MMGMVIGGVTGFLLAFAVGAAWCLHSRQASYLRSTECFFGIVLPDVHR